MIMYWMGLLYFLVRLCTTFQMSVIPLYIVVFLIAVAVPAVPACLDESLPNRFATHI